jgi:hypothetical protein
MEIGFFALACLRGSSLPEYFLDRKKEARIINFEFNRKEGERCKAVGAGECFKKFAR